MIAAQSLFHYWNLTVQSQKFKQYYVAWNGITQLHWLN